MIQLENGIQSKKLVVLLTIMPVILVLEPVNGTPFLTNAVLQLIQPVRNVKPPISGIPKLVSAVLKVMKLAISVQPMECGMQFKEFAAMLLILNARTVEVKINGTQLSKYVALTFMTQPHHHANVQAEITILKTISAVLNRMILNLSPVFAQVENTMKFRTLVAHQLYAAVVLSPRHGTIN